MPDFTTEPTVCFGGDILFFTLGVYTIAAAAIMSFVDIEPLRFISPLRFSCFARFAASSAGCLSLRGHRAAAHTATAQRRSVLGF